MIALLTVEEVQAFRARQWSMPDEKSRLRLHDICDLAVEAIVTRTHAQTPLEQTAKNPSTGTAPSEPLPSPQPRYGANPNCPVHYGDAGNIDACTCPQEDGGMTRKILQETSWLLTEILAKDWPPTRMEVEEARHSALKLEGQLYEYLHRDVDVHGKTMERQEDESRAEEPPEALEEAPDGSGPAKEESVVNKELFHVTFTDEQLGKALLEYWQKRTGGTAGAMDVVCVKRLMTAIGDEGPTLLVLTPKLG